MIANAPVIATHLSDDSHGARVLIATLATGETFMARLDPPGEWSRVLGPILETVRNEHVGPVSGMEHHGDAATPRPAPVLSGGADERANADLE